MFFFLLLVSAVCFIVLTTDILRLVWQRHRVPHNPQALAEWTVLLVFVSVDLGLVLTLWQILNGQGPAGFSSLVWVFQALAGVFCWAAVRSAQTDICEIFKEEE